MVTVTDTVMCFELGTRKQGAGLGYGYVFSCPAVLYSWAIFSCVTLSVAVRVRVRVRVRIGVRVRVRVRVRRFVVTGKINGYSGRLGLGLGQDASIRP